MKKNNVLHLLILLVILGCGTLMFYLAAGNKTLQVGAGIITAISYVLWGILHHAHGNNLHKNIVIEYLLIGAIAIVLLLTLAL